MSADTEKMLRARFTRRLLLLGGAQAGLFGLLIHRLHQLQIVEGKELAALAENNRTAVRLIAPERGLIYDRFGARLASNQENLRVSIIPEQTEDVAEALDAIRRIAPVSQRSADRALRLARRQSRHIPIIVAERLTWRQFALLNVLAPQLPGVMTDRSSIRVYHDAANLGHVLGYVGAADETEIDQAPVMRVPGFRIGKAGVERAFDLHLRGEAGNSKIEVDARGRSVRGLSRTSSVQGNALVLTIDRVLQDVAARRLAQERRASLVALDVRTGDILIMASTPGFDPNDMVRDITPENWKALIAHEDRPLRNKATQGQYPPGSTFKMITALAGLETGEITPDTRITCPGAFRLGRARFRCWKGGGHGRLALHDAIKRSCDVYFYETAHRLGIDRLATMARRFGLGSPTGCELPDEKPGLVPDTAWKRAEYDEPFWGGEVVISGIGQGFLLTTVVQLATMAARLATGLQVTPHLTFGGRIAGNFAPMGLNPDHLAVVQGGMDAVVNEPGGTAGRSKLELEHVRMAGKTGTSQVTRLSVGRHYTSMPYHLRDHGLFVAYAPVDAPRYAVACVVEHGGGGSTAAAPIVKDVMTALLERDPASRPTPPAGQEHDIARSRGQERI